MSYDLYFNAREGAAPVRSTLLQYFKARKNFQVSDKQAVYQNSETGVYFWFDFTDESDEEAPGNVQVSFGLNYYRPHIFGLEAEPEVKAFVEKFQLLVSDPQMGGMGDGEYSTAGFLQGWNLGNEFGYKGIQQQNRDHNPLMLPSAKIEACWRWNKQRDELQQSLGENIFVPRFMFIQRGEAVHPVVAWPDGIPLAAPQADFFIIQRKTIFPRKFFIRPAEDMVVASWNEVEKAMEQFPLKQAALPYRLLSYQAVPPALLSFLLGLSPSSEKLQGVSADKILNSELVELALKGGS